MTKKIILILILIFTSIVCKPLFCSKKDISIGKVQMIHSKILKEYRPILISVPEGYSNSDMRYPVIYVLDGETSFLPILSSMRMNAESKLCPQLIVVGIVNSDRMRDLTPTKPKNNSYDLPQYNIPKEALKSSGGAGNMLNFFQDELIPFIDKNYRTNSFKIIYGHSYGGLFSVYTLLTSPDTFNAYLCATPSLWWDNQILFKDIEERIAKINGLHKYLYFTVGGFEDEIQVGAIQKFGRIMVQNKPKNLTLGFRYMNGEDHGSQRFSAMNKGIRFIFEKWKFPNLLYQELDSKGITILKEYYNNIKKDYGILQKLPEVMVNDLGYMFLNQKKFDQALECFLYNTKYHSGYGNTFDSLGEAYEAEGKYKLAKKNYQIAIKKGGASDKNLKLYQSHLKRVEKKLQKGIKNEIN